MGGEWVSSVMLDGKKKLESSMSKDKYSVLRGMVGTISHEALLSSTKYCGLSRQSHFNYCR